MTRRALLRRTVRSAIALPFVGSTLASACAAVPPPAPRGANDTPAMKAAGFGPLQPPDANGVRLPKGFTSRVIARSGQVVEGTRHVWHREPDGGATFATQSGGWIYTSNCELRAEAGGGGVGAIRFAPDASIEAAYSILQGTNRNCAGGATPWQTWLSCEEVPRGLVYECNPFEPGSQGVARPALGVFEHEAVAVDPVRRHLYMTEDRQNGLLYRFNPTRWTDLSEGQLEALEILDPEGRGPIRPGETREVVWHPVPDPAFRTAPTHLQVPGASPFKGGEGCDYAEGFVFFATKHDNRIWRLETESNRISIVYDRATSATPAMMGVDNVLALGGGGAFVAEDGGSMQIVALAPSGRAEPLLQVVGPIGSEITGPALDPSGSRLYFSSQRDPGTTFEVRGPFQA